MKLENACLLIVDTEHKTAPRQEQGFPSIRTPNIGRGRLELEGVYRVSEETYRIWTRRAIPQVDDLILAREAPVGNVAIIPEGVDVCLGQRTVLLRPNKDVTYPLYLCYYLLSPKMQNKILSRSGGSTVSHLNMKDIRNLDLEELPTLETQKRIAPILSNYDDLIENNLKRIKLLEETAQNIYKEWFVNFRFPNYEHTEFDAESGLPVGWEMKKISELVSFKGGYPFKSSEYKDNAKFRIVTIKNVGDRFFDGNNTSGIENIPDKMKDFCKLKEGDVLMSLTGNIGRTCLVYGDNYLLNQRVVVIEPVNFEYKAFCYFLFNTDSIKGLMNNLASGVAQQNLSPVKLEEQIILLPPSNLMLQYSSLINGMISQIILLYKQNQKLKEARDILLPRLMNRTIEV